MPTWEIIENAKKDKKHELILSGAEISAKIEETGLDLNLFQLTDLNYLNVHETRLNLVPDQISNLLNLQTLVLHSNKLQALPECIGQLSKLKILDVSRNELRALPKEFGSLSQLTTLNASSNQLETFPADFKTAKLSVLDLANNKLVDFSTVCTSDFASLADLKLNGNAIESVPSSISSLPALKNLELSSNRITAIPGELIDCNKLKEVNFKSNPIADKRLMKLIDQCRSKQILDYVKQHCARTNPNAGAAAKTGKGNKKGQNKAEDGQSDEQNMDKLCHKISVLFADAEMFNVKICDEVKQVRPYIICCIVPELAFDEASFKKFIQIQTKLHDTVCDKRNAATIATHDLAKLTPGDLTFTAKPPNELEICPLGKSKKFTGAQLYNHLQAEAENLRKEKKRNVYSGIHKYLYLLDGKPKYPCLLDAENTVISFPPITNSDDTKMSVNSTGMLVEVTSASSQGVCKKALDQLLKELLLLGVSSAKREDGSEKCLLKVRQVKIVDLEGNMKCVYPSKTDLIFEGDKSIVIARE